MKWEGAKKKSLQYNAMWELIDYDHRTKLAGRSNKYNQTEAACKWLSATNVTS